MLDNRVSQVDDFDKWNSSENLSMLLMLYDIWLWNNRNIAKSEYQAKYIKIK